VGEYTGCLKLSDLSDISFIAERFEQMSKEDQFSNSMDEVINDLVPKVQTVMARLMEAQLGESIATDNICFGNFDGTRFENAADASLFTDPLAEDGCQYLPINDASRYTVLAAGMTVPKYECGGATGKDKATVCIAMSKCPETNLPTFAVDINDQFLSCLAYITGAGAVASTVNQGASLVGEYSVGYGLSLANQFHIDLPLYSGLPKWEDKLITYTMKGMKYDKMRGTIDAKTFTKTEKPLVALGGSRTRILGIEGLDSDTIDSIFNSYKEEYNDAGELVNDVVDSFMAFGKEVSLQAAEKTDLEISFKFSNLKGSLGKLLPDSETFELASTNMFLQTAATHRNITSIDGKISKIIAVRPGIYAFAGIGGVQNVIAGLFEYMLNFLQSAIDTIPFIGKKLKLEDILKGILDNTDAQEEDDMGVGVAITDEYFGIIFSVPFGFGDIGYFKAECKFQYEGTEMDCSIKTHLSDPLFWKTQWKNVKNGANDAVLFIAKKSDELFETTSDIIAVGVDDVKEIFSKENIEKTKNDIRNGAIELKEDFNKEIEKFAWKNLPSTNFDHPTNCVEKEFGQMFECVGTKYECTKDQLQCTSKQVTDAATCGSVWVTDAGKCGTAWVTDKDCGTEYVKCGTKTVTDGATCGWNAIKKFFGSKKAKSCSVDVKCWKNKSSDLPKSCSAPKTCSVEECKNVKVKDICVDARKCDEKIQVCRQYDKGGLCAPVYADCTNIEGYTCLPYPFGDKPEMRCLPEDLFSDPEDLLTQAGDQLVDKYTPKM